MLIHELKLTGLLSFGPATQTLEMRPLNVLIGPNGSGKSNLLEAVGLLRAAPRDLSAPVKEAGGVRDWLWKGDKSPKATIEAIVDYPDFADAPIRHRISFAEHGRQFEVNSEQIENAYPLCGEDNPQTIYGMEDGEGALYEKTETRESIRSLPRESINPKESILSQVRDPERYPALAHLTSVYGRIRMYREWSFGRYTNPRQPQKADLPHEYLSETCENLALVLNAIRPHAKHDIISGLNALYPEIDDFNVQIVGGWVQLYLEEGRFSIPATRLSDGTLRYLCLLAILCHPTPPPLVCIEEPELGLHPDVLPGLARLLIEASQKCQLVVTTHSDILVDALTETPESVVVCEKHDGMTQLRRLDAGELSEWLSKYRLGQLWLRGDLGGARW